MHELQEGRHAMSIQQGTNETRTEQRVSWKRRLVSERSAALRPCRRYIKELADRLNTLENSMIPPPSGEMQYAQAEAEAHSPRASEEYSPLSSSAAGSSKQPRKRTHSVTNEPSNTAYLQHLPPRASVSGWSAQDAPRHLPHPASTLQTPQTPHSASSAGDPSTYNQPFRSQFSPNGGHAQPVWGHGPPELTRAASSSGPYDPIESRSSEHEQNTAILEWHEQTVDEYDWHHAFSSPFYD